ncbi:hypothetical protein PIIN_10721 [Serendipita indica DSM 11827]|uniref:Uncharacterized protein n=1 Tax=Serendipita indica (strain DSM 11827) TaxID=1109443 RepID=G4TZJ0_SERID|nr:hypothetical protein PIIN_10721 [Serendipita indica DSM 11827]
MPLATPPCSKQPTVYSASKGEINDLDRLSSPWAEQL